jgi:maltokinase
MNLTDYLVDQRWFGSKAREIAHSDVLEEIPLADGVSATFVEAVFSPGTHETYQLIRSGSEHGDALADHAGVLLDLIRRNADVEHDESILRFRSLEEIGGYDPAHPARPVGAEQSNS